MTANELLITLRTHHRTMAGYLKDAEAGRTVNHYDVEALGLEIAKCHRLYQQALIEERAAQLAEAA